MVNPDADGYIKTLNQPKILLKLQQQQPTAKHKILKPNNRQSGGPVFKFRLTGGVIRPSDPRQLPLARDTISLRFWTFYKLEAADLCSLSN